MPELEEVFRMSTQKVRPEPGALERQFGKQRRRSTRQKVAVYALVAGLVAGTAIGIASLGRDEERPANPNPEPSVPAVDGLAPTPNRLEGIWLEDGPPSEFPVLVRFGTDGTFAIDDTGELDNDPFAAGTYEIDDRTISFTTGASKGCLSGERWAWRMGLPEEGRLEGVHVLDEGTGDCSRAVGSPWRLTRISPTSPRGREIAAGPLAADSQPPSWFRVQGIWLEEGTGRLIRISGLTYSIAVGGTFGADAGTLVLDDERATITFTSGPDAAGCDEGDRMVWQDVLVDIDVLTAVVRSDDCTGRSGAELTWIHVAAP